MKDTYDIEPAAGGGVDDGRSRGRMVAMTMAKPNRPSSMSCSEVRGDKKIQVIKVVREATGLGLKEAKAIRR